MSLNIEKLSKKKIQFELKDPLKKTNIQICLPDLKGLSFETWGDWGPMYQFDLNPNQPIEIDYDGKKQSLDKAVLRIESPVRAKDRQKNPFYCVIDDSENGIRYYLYLNEKYNLDKIKIERRQKSMNIKNFSFEPLSFQEAM